MREVRERKQTYAELATTTGRDLEAGCWKLLLSKLALPEVTLDGQGIRFPEYVPVLEMLAEGLRQLDSGEILARRCERCGEYHDLNVAEGIYADPEAMEGFLCRPCSEAMSAWEYFNEHLKR